MPRHSLSRRLRVRYSRTGAGLVLILTTALCTAACSGRQASPQALSSQAPSPQPTSSVAPATTTAPRLIKYPKTQLVLQPCLSLDERDLAALGISGPGKEESGVNGPSCVWKVAGQNVNLHLDVPLSYAQAMTKGGRVSQVPVGQRRAVQAEFQHICFIFLALDETDHLISATSIPEPGSSQEGTCPAGAAVVAAAMTHIA